LPPAFWVWNVPNHNWPVNSAQVLGILYEYETFVHGPHRFRELAYVPRHLAGVKQWELFEKTGENWYDFDAIRPPFEPEIWLVPLHGHTRGQSGIAIRPPGGWHFHVGDAGVDIEGNSEWRLDRSNMLT
jgi:glyoxylase-like metal-dependent hydrolase (beta-lactamase superfamily II)